MQSKCQNMTDWGPKLETCCTVTPTTENTEHSTGFRSLIVSQCECWYWHILAFQCAFSHCFATKVTVTTIAARFILSSPLHFLTVSAIPPCLCDTFPKFGDLISHRVQATTLCVEENLQKMEPQAVSSVKKLVPRFSGTTGCGGHGLASSESRHVWEQMGVWIGDIDDPASAVPELQRTVLQVAWAAVGPRKCRGPWRGHAILCIARPHHEPPAILSCTPGLAGYPFDPTQLWHG